MSTKKKAATPENGEAKPSQAITGGEMPKGTKGPTTAKSVYVKFSKPSDVDLYNQLAAEADADERELGTYILFILRKRNPATPPAGA